MQFTFNVQSSTDPKLNGPVTYHIPTLYERIQIGKRKTQLCAPYKWEDMPQTERSLTEALCTLEFIIDTAPEGWWTTEGGERLLEIGTLAEHQEHVLWEVYADFIVNRERFRPGAQRSAGNGGPNSNPTDLEGSQSTEP
ncbi:hypothetical protein [Deinococcus cellulosilyticus]|uniref:Uncharacterized protein n=1 Tax=Deinococcus cellulosilyticus (strain DSM 18568 / NBRC 106333 / KACC 11606 / 5516J-15) TaxID=1223518 RepID=A0A511N782_DEIC1|nr:hypothetical protein [Deinococcus cellulosilyticus]GEM48690.1 hypothetical protein DC3_43250 [Deinococcus cellulosilyticus NBRC 106333 = KACC 11606]